MNTNLPLRERLHRLDRLIKDLDRGRFHEDLEPQELAWALRELVRDAARLNWLLNGNGFFMEERSLCGVAPTTAAERQSAIDMIDEAMREGHK